MSRMRADMWLLLIAVIWGSTFVVVKNALDTVGPFVFVASRFAVGGALLMAIYLARPRKALTPHLWRDGLITGLFLTAGFLTQTLGLQTTEAGKAAFITGLNVVLVPAFAALLLRHLPAAHALAGVGLAAVGLGFMTLDEQLTLEQGDLWVLACAVAFALHIISISRYSHRHDVLPFTLIQFLTTTVCATIAALVYERGALIPPVGSLPAILYMGVVATALVFGLQNLVQRYTTPTHTALIFALEPVFAALFAIWLAGEQLEAREWIGGGMILAGMLLAEIGDMLRQRGSVPVASPEP